MRSEFAFLEHDGVIAFSHRGGTSTSESNMLPENTLPAFQHSIDLGYVYLETDVHLSADDVLFAFHDPNLKARTGLNADIADLSAAEIEQLKVDGVAAIPRLSEIFMTWPQARLNIDAKSDAAVLPLIDAVREHKALDRVCLGSFIDRRVRKFRSELGPGLCTSMGRFEAFRFWLAGWGLADPSFISAACAQVPAHGPGNFASQRILEVADDCGIQVHYWTVNERDAMNELVDLGADGIMTDETRILKDVLIERGAWPRQGVTL